MTLQFKNLITLEQDMAGKWRATVDAGEEVITLKFQNQPTLKEVEDETKRNIDNRAITKVREIENIKNDITDYQQKITSLQSRKADLEAIK